MSVVVGAPPGELLFISIASFLITLISVRLRSSPVVAPHLMFKLPAFSSNPAEKPIGDPQSQTRSRSVFVCLCCVVPVGVRRRHIPHLVPPSFNHRLFFAALSIFCSFLIGMKVFSFCDCYQPLLHDPSVACHCGIDTCASSA